jgi:hypothetical protein
MNESLMQFLQAMGQSGQSPMDLANGKAATMDKNTWQPSTPQDMMNQVQQPMPSTLMNQMQGGMGGMQGQMPPQDANGQPTPSSLMGQMSQGVSPQMNTPVAAPESQPVASMQPANYGGIVQEQAQKDKPMDMGSMMSMLQGGMGAFKDVSGEKAKPGFLGGLLKTYLGGALGGG